jgi:hypothetical protein
MRLFGCSRLGYKGEKPACQLMNPVILAPLHGISRQ